MKSYDSYSCSNNIKGHYFPFIALISKVLHFKCRPFHHTLEKMVNTIKWCFYKPICIKHAISLNSQFLFEFLSWYPLLPGFPRRKVYLKSLPVFSSPFQSFPVLPSPSQSFPVLSSPSQSYPILSSLFLSLFFPVIPSSIQPLLGPFFTFGIST